MIKNEVTAFYYHLGLHYSQTYRRAVGYNYWFYYHLGLHYSQTIRCILYPNTKFYYHLGLHYSQTSNSKYWNRFEQIHSYKNGGNPRWGVFFHIS